MNEMNFRRAGAAAIAPDLRSVAGEPASGSRAAPLLKQWLSIIRRRRWVIIGAIALCVLAGLIVTLLMTPKYTAATTLEIQRESQNIANVRDANPRESAVDQEFYQTQYGLLKARSLADRVAVQLRLHDDAGFFQMFGVDEAGDWFENGRPAGNATREKRIRRAGDILLANIAVSPERLSRLVVVSFKSPDAAFSKKVVDAWVTNFIQATLERRYEANSYARRFLEQRLAQLRDRLDQSERLLVSYAAQQRIINLPATTPAQGDGGMSGERSLVAEDLVTLNRELARATAERISTEARMRAAGQGMSPEALQNDTISGLRQRRAELAGEYSRLLTQFEPAYPPAQALANQLQQIDRSIAREESRVRGTVAGTFQASVARESELRKRVEALQSGMLDLRRRSIQYNIYQRDVDTNRQLYDGLLQRYKEIGVAGGVGVNNISVVDPARVPEGASSPKPLLNIAVALLAGLALGIAAALALEQIDEAVSDPAEIEGMIGIPVIGTTPKIAQGDPIDALADRKSSLTEAYLSVQTNLALSTDHGVPKSMAVTSTRPAEGKSTTSYAIALLLSRAGRKTLLIDADMRSPSLQDLTGLTNERGLSNVLAGNDDLSGLIQATANENLFVMLAGPQPPSAAELLVGDRLNKLIARLSQQFDQIVLDAPPVMGLADAPLIGSKVEGTIFVVEARGTKRGMAQVAIERLRSANVTVLGAVLSKFESKHAHYGYGYDYGYGYGSAKA
jgi:capsular exopolysaccharide synthesis family protein